MEKIKYSAQIYLGIATILVYLRTQENLITAAFMILFSIVTVYNHNREERKKNGR